MTEGLDASSLRSRVRTARSVSCSDLGLFRISKTSEFRISSLRRALGADRAKEGRAQVAVAAVGQDDDDRAVRHLVGDGQRPGHGGAAGHADEDALVGGQQPGGLEGLAVFDGDLLVQQARVVDARDRSIRSCS